MIALLAQDTVLLLAAGFVAMLMRLVWMFFVTLEERIDQL